MIGLQLAAAGCNGEAIDYYTRAETVRRTLAGARPASVTDRDELATCQTNIADLFRKAGRRDEARALCERARAVCEALVRDHPQFTQYRGGLAETELRTGQMLLDDGDAAGAAPPWKRAVAQYESLKNLTISQTFFRSCCHAGLAGLAARPNSGASVEQGQAESDRAMSWLRRAVAMGYRNPDVYRTPPRPAPRPARLPGPVDGRGVPGRAVRPRQKGPTDLPIAANWIPRYRLSLHKWVAPKCPRASVRRHRSRLIRGCLDSTDLRTPRRCDRRRPLRGEPSR